MESAVQSALAAEKLGLPHDAIVLSAKVSDVRDLIRVYRDLARRGTWALHLGLTEAGIGTKGIVASSAALGVLLSEGIGDTMRVSLTADPVEEVPVACGILSALELRRRGPEIVSCPTCARCQVDLIEIADEVTRRLASCTKPITVAVMGCVVNGPGEASDADVGVACGRGSALLFRHGEVVRKVDESQIVDALIEEVEAL